MRWRERVGDVHDRHQYSARDRHGFLHASGRKNRIAEATAVGIVGLALAVVLGKPVAASALGGWFQLSRGELLFAMAAYGFLASVLPVWMLLAPSRLSQLLHEDRHCRLSRHWRPDCESRAEDARADGVLEGGGPIVPGPLFPFVFITIACGAISGFHSLIGSGTTPKMIDKESDIRPIGYGAMLMEGLVGVIAMIAATVLYPGGLLRHQHPTPGVCRIGIPRRSISDAGSRGRRSGGGPDRRCRVVGRGNGAGIQRAPRHERLMDYWYHFAIMFEALFILTTIDAGTRVGEVPRAGVPGPCLRAVRTRGLDAWIGHLGDAGRLGGWSYFIATGSIDTIWPMFGIANQLLASVALAVGTT